MKDIIAFTTMKNEGPYMLEWIAHYRMLGVDSFVIFTNDCLDGTDRIAMRLEELGIAKHVDNAVQPRNKPQRQMFQRMYANPEWRDAKWLFCLDCDEFLNVRHPSGSLQGVIDHAQTNGGYLDAISFAWKLFGTGGNVTFEDAPLTRRFLLADNEDRYHSSRAFGLKTLFRNNDAFGGYRPHRPHWLTERREVRWSDPSGNKRPTEKIGWRAWPGFDHSQARMHHYAVRSLESFLVKRDRGRTNHVGDDQGEQYWLDMNANHVRDESIVPLAERADPIRAELHGDDVLAQLHADAVGWHREKIAGLRARDDWAEFRGWLSRHLYGQREDAAA